MWERYRKTSVFLKLLFGVNFLLLFLSLNFVSSAENRRVTIAMIGDSLTQGFGLMPEDNLVSQLQMRLLEDNFSVDLLNFGVSGDTTAGGLERFDWSVSSDVSGVVIILGGNDLLRGIPPDHSFENLRKMIIKAKKRGLPTLLVGIRASANFGSDYKIKFDKMYKLLQTEFDIFYYENFFSAISHKDVSLFLSFMQQDGIHPNAAGIKKIVADFYPTFKEFVEHAFLIN